nr:MAG TPA: tail fiber protein [Caudoviricetes sp.]
MSPSLKEATNEMYSTFSYTADGGTTEFVVPFPYLYIDDVHVYLDGEEEPVYPAIFNSKGGELPPPPYNIWWTSESTLKFLNAPVEGTIVGIRRITNRLTPEVEFNNASILTEEDLNTIVTQLLYIAQEAYDNLNSESAVEAAERAKEYLELIKTYVENGISLVGLKNYVSGMEDTLTVEEDLPEGSIINIPPGMKYLVGRHHLRIAYDGVVISPRFFEEVGEKGDESNQVKILFPLYQGQELDFWVIPLGEAGVILEEVREEGAENIAKAKEQADRAEEEASKAASSAESAASSAQASSEQASDAEVSAERALDYMNQASQKAGEAWSSAQTAVSNASAAEESATAAEASAVTATEKAQEASSYADNAQNSATAASSSASEAAMSAEEAQSSASTATEKAQEAAESAEAAAASAQNVQGILNQTYRYKGSVETYDDLPTENVAIGDVYDVKLTDINYAWTGTAWDALGGRTSIVIDEQPTEGSSYAVSSGGVFSALASLQEGVEAAETEAERIDSCLVTSLSNVPSNLREGGIIILQTTV